MLFLDGINEQNSKAVAAVDISGSTAQDMCGESVFMRFKRYLESTGIGEFRLIFWDSEMSKLINEQGERRGYEVVPMAVENSRLGFIFGLMQEKIFGQTRPDIGMREACKLLSTLGDSYKDIYLLTDGQMNGCTKQQFAESVRHLTQTHPSARLHLVAVQDRNIDVNSESQVCGGAGGDVYEALVLYSLTDILASFCSVSRNHLEGYTHLSRLRAPPGCLAFGQKFFLETNLRDFYLWLRDEIATHAGDEAWLTCTLQHLSATLSAFDKDKSECVQTATRRNFAALFCDTCIGFQWALFALEQGVAADRRGQAQILSTFRSRLKTAFKEADMLLQRDVTLAICERPNDFFFTLPARAKQFGQFYGWCVNRVPMTATRLAITANRNTYKNGAFQCGDVRLCCFPVLGSAGSRMKQLETLSDQTVMGGPSEQCLRQWLRTAISTTYGINHMKDDCIYMIMALHALFAKHRDQIRAQTRTETTRDSNNVQSDTGDSDDALQQLDDYVNTLRALALIALRKKRLNSVDTELARLVRGEAPVPNSGRIEDLHSALRSIGDKLHVQPRVVSETQSWQFWKFICQSFGFAEQNKHCMCDSNDVEFTLASDSSDSDGPATVVFQNIVNALDYSCVITLEDTSQTGGFMLRAHTSLTGSACAPRFVLSADGATFMKQYASCVVCMQRIDESYLVPVGPSVHTDDVIKHISPDFIAITSPQSLVQVSISGAEPFNASARTSTSSASSASSASNASSASSASTGSRAATVQAGKNVCLVVLKGTVGCGKSTFAANLKQEAESRGFVVFVCSPDKVCVERGCDMRQACTIVSETLGDFIAQKDPKQLVIVDTCNENTHKKTEVIFGCKFGPRHIILVNWTDGCSLEQYLAFSLHNVLSRPAHSRDSNFYLNPVTASRDVCISVHRKKATTVFSAKKVKQAYPQITALPALHAQYSAALPSFDFTAFVSKLEAQFV